MALRHFIYSKETSPFTWVTPAHALWVDSAQITGKREILPQRTTGAGRTPILNVQGAKPVNGPLSTKWWLNNIGQLFSTFLLKQVIGTVVDTGVYDHGLSYDDDAAFLALSIQKQYTADLGINILGAAVNALTINAATKEEAKLDFDLIAKDEAPCGGVWDYDGATASPAVIEITNQYPALARPLMFYDANIVIGGTVAYDAVEEKLSVDSGTTYTRLRSLSIALNHNLDADAYGLVQDPTLQEISPGNRDITATFDISWTDYSSDFYEAARAGEAMALVFDLIGPLIDATYHHEAHIIIPSLYFNPVQLPPLDGDYTGKLLQVTGAAQVEPTTGYDFNLWLRTDEATL